MARPISVTDEEIFVASRRLLADLGPANFTLSLVAREVGLTRAAIAQRFGTKEALKYFVMHRMTTELEEKTAALAIELGPDGLITIARWLGQSLRNRQASASFWGRLSANFNDTVLAEMEERRGAIMRALVGRAMPQTRVGHSDAINAFMAHMTGSMMNWQMQAGDDPLAYMEKRARIWMALAGIEADTPVKGQDDVLCG